MNEFSRSSRVPTVGNPNWLLPVIAVGILAGIALRFLAPDFLAQTAVVGQIFGGILLVVSVPLVTCQLALALNNPRDRVRRGVSHSKILVQVVITTAVFLVITGVLTTFFSIQDSRGFAATFLQNFNPVELVNFSASGGGYVFLGIALLIAAVLGAMGEKAQEMVTICGRISRASIRTFRLAMWLAPIGLLSMIGTLGTQSQASLSTSSLTALALVLTAITGLLLYSSIVLGVDWVVGQLRPARKDGRRFERTSRVGQRPTGGRTSMPSRSGSSPRPVGRPAPDSRRDRDRERERSPFEMGVSSTPVLDIASPNAPKNTPTSANTDDTRRNDFRSRPNRDSQTEAPRPSGRGAEREPSSESPRPGYRDRGPRPERREGSRDSYRDRGPRGPRPDRPTRDRGPRPDRFDRSQTARPTEHANESESSAPVNRSIDPATAAADLARVREQLSQSPQREPQAAERPVTPEYSRPERVSTTPPPERTERPVVSQEQPPAIEQVTAEMHYGRSRHRKHERPESESRPGVEPPPMPEMVDHYSTDDMAFGRGKKKKTVK